MRKSWILIAAVIPLVALGSIVVWNASGDEPRRQGALGSDEAVTLSWRGEWNGQAEYATGNVVALEGASYVAEGEKVGKPEPGCETCGWTLMGAAAAGAGGAAGAGAEEKSGTGGAAAGAGGSGAGAAGAAIAGYEIVKGDLVIPVGQSQGTQVVSCPPGKKVLSGGSHSAFIEYDGPVGPDTPYFNGGVYGWRFGATYQGGGATIYVYAICSIA